MNYLQRTRLLLFITLSLQLPRKRSLGRHILSWQESSLVDQTCVCSGMAKQPGQERLALLRNPHQSLSKWDLWLKSLLGDESREWKEWWREYCAVGSESALGPKTASFLSLQYIVLAVLAL